MLDDLTLLDLVAFGTFIGLWGGFSLVFRGRHGPARSINARMAPIRVAWMVRLLERENRIVDAQLNGSSIATASFFASATIIVIAALLGVLGVADEVHAVTDSLSSLVGSSSLAVFELKLFVMIALFIYAFFKFTWSIRQFSYFSAIVGSAAYYAPGEADREVAGCMAAIRSEAVEQLNAGLRAYYFALATLGWFIHPLVFMGTSALITAVLTHRQLMSRAAKLIADHSERME